jgi:hypothetical protein
MSSLGLAADARSSCRGGALLATDGGLWEGAGWAIDGGLTG